MSSGRNLTNRQRRGRTLIETNPTPPPPLELFAFDDAEHTLSFRSTQKLIVDTNASHWNDCQLVDDIAAALTQVELLSPQSFKLHYSAGVTGGTDWISTGVNRTIQNELGAPAGPLRFFIDPPIFWPPRLA